ncbi:hypothetical protein [Paenibacillus thermotolerans]|uniref:hypothetical protein n=1 Tax=Paenibacillus thermotolerans TaxID=3027807 RepID=UPI0023689E6B|nr:MULTISPECIES: hypothetical protein [unclassified Paenibacillus]
MEKMKTYIIIVLVLALVFTIYLLMQNRREEDRRREQFLNQFYFAATQASSHMEKIIKDRKINRDQVQDLQDDLRRLDHTLSATELYVKNGPHYGRFYNSVAEVLEGWTHNGVKMADHFGLDGNLSAEEEQILKLVMNDLKQITEGMYSDAAKQEDKNMTMDRFNRLVTSVALANLSDLAQRIEEQNNIQPNV